MGKELHKEIVASPNLTGEIWQINLARCYLVDNTWSNQVIERGDYTLNITVSDAWTSSPIITQQKPTFIDSLDKGMHGHHKARRRRKKLARIDST